jgi:hypothetical protein
LAAADQYFAWLCVARKCLATDGPSERSELPAAAGAALAADLLDMDAAIARHCAAAGIAEPCDLEDRERLHLEILYQQIGEATGGGL